MKLQLETATVHYESRGRGTPILTLHGFFVDHLVMKGCMEPLFKEDAPWQRIYFDLPGMGRTELKTEFSSSDDIFSLVLDFVDAVLPNKRFLLVGESYGGYLARALLRKRPEQVLGLLLVCPVIIPEKEKRTLPEHVVLHRDLELMEELVEREDHDFLSMAVVQSRKSWERYREEVVPGVRLAQVELLDQILENAYPLSFDVDQLETPFMGPTLFIMGRQDPVVGYRDAFQIIENYPRASFAVLDRAGHVLQQEQEEQFRVLTLDWLERALQELSE